MKIYILTLLTALLFLSCGSEDSDKKGSETIQPERFIKVLSNGSDFPVDSTIIVEFHREVDQTSINENRLYLLDESGNRTDIDTEFRDSMSLIITPHLYLQPQSTYTLHITKDVQLLNSFTTIAEDFSWSFTTGKEVDSKPPTLIRTSVESGSTVTVKTIFSFIFDEFIEYNDPENMRFSLQKSGGDEVSGVVKRIGNTVRFRPESLELNSSYTLSFNYNLIDLSQNRIESSVEIEFQTFEKSQEISELNSSRISAGSLYAIDSDSSFIYASDSDGKVIKLDSNGSFITSKSIEDITDLAVWGSFLYVVCHSGEIHKLQKSDLSSVKTVKSDTPIFDIEIRDGLLYLAGTDSGLLHYDNSLNPIASYSSYGNIYAVKSDSSSLYLLSKRGEITILDINTLEKFSSIVLKGEIRDLEQYGDKIYVANGYSGVSIIDKVLNRPVGRLSVADYSSDVEIIDGFLYVADSSGGVKIYSIDDDNRFLGEFGESSFQLSNANRRLYITEKDSGLLILELESVTNILISEN